LPRITSRLSGLSPHTPTVGGSSEAASARCRDPLPSADSLTLGEYVTPDQLAQHLGMSVRTLSRWHARRIGPPRCSVGKLILYRVTAVRAWLAESEAIPVALGTRQAGVQRK
jgi:hypothetical protein